ncbi:MAG: hypothetical protein LBT49_03210 [Prevotellaceae bacterium]|jgi:hypothetical protein|nr:hypothetical protein [Prevotellaceae bacterium]
MLNTTTQRNPLATTLVCLTLLLLLWIPSLVFPITPEALHLNFMMPLQQWAIDSLQLQGQAGIRASFAVIALSTCFLFAINRRHLFVAGQEQLMLPLFVLISSAVPYSQQFSGAQVATLLVLLSIYYLFNSIQMVKALSSVFLAAFFTTLAGLFYLPSAIMLLVIFIGVLISKPFEWRDWVAYLTGMLTPCFYLVLRHYLRYGNFTGFGRTVTENLPVPATPDFALSLPETLLFVFLGMLALCAFLPLKASGRIIKVKSTRMRQILRCLFLFLLIPLLLFGASPGIMPLAAIPLSILAADYYDHIRRRKVFNLLLFLLCVVIAGIRIL